MVSASKARQSVQIGGFALSECMFACWWDTVTYYVDQEVNKGCPLLASNIAFHKFDFNVAMSAFKVVRISCSCQTSELLWNMFQPDNNCMKPYNILLFSCVVVLGGICKHLVPITDRAQSHGLPISNKRWENSCDLCEYPTVWYSEYVNPYILTHNPWGRLKWPSASTRLTAHFIEAWCLLWWFASNEDSMDIWGSIPTAGHV